MTEKSRYGFGEKKGLGNRLVTWVDQLSRDKRYPWLGTGIIADMTLAAQLLGAERTPGPPEEEDEFANFKPAPVEYDL